MKLRADFHIHTHYSVDGYMSPEDLVSRARLLRLDIIGVADHGTCKGALKTKELTRGNPLVLVGQEVKTCKGEILVFCLENDLEEEKPLVQTCREAKKLGGFIVVPHPFDMFRYGIGDSIKDIMNYADAIEGFNSKCIFDMFNKKAIEFARKNRKPVIAGSDAHFASDIGSAVTIINCERNEKSVFDAIKKGKTEISGNKTSVSRNVVTRIRKTLKSNKRAGPKL